MKTMLLSKGSAGHTYRIEEVLGREKIQKQLMNMGVVPGTEIRLISRLRGNFIAVLKSSRLGISDELAETIIVTPLEK